MNHNLWIIYYGWTSNIFSITILIECIRLLYLFQYDGALIRFFVAILVLRLLKQAALWISCWASTSNRGSWDLTHAREKKKNKETLEEYKLIEKEINKRLLKKNGSLYYGTFSRTNNKNIHYVIIITSSQLRHWFL